ncbi:hypothetical protein OKA05_10285 [Luteolibacter arcticus]|uniref:Nucleotidyl transferase AbiEii toxin, Type IV TA system n=1 Tax=Luteolibacter arcticus TaxID=1581411 RepID=A0ABT3GH83_9BACT|nr:hypothetical protein [Luteolibacter arcticus]MCW1922939.1 hypothetical protein [Luteolibacter arcticus]
MGELCIFGGATMILAFDARLSTRDVDAVFIPKSEISKAAEQVAEDLELPASWLNDGVKGFVSAAGELTDEGMPQWPNLRILRPSTRYLLAMKCMASRVAGYDTGGDRGDIVLLCKELGFTSSREILDVVAGYCPADMIPAKAAFFIEEIVGEMEGGAF